jgi:hypothetical protein
VKVYHSVEREFANFKFSGTFALFSESLWNNFFTDKNTISNRTFALCQINYLQALITLPICACSTQLLQLAQELQFYHRRCFCKEGHLGASLGVIELTIALHYVFNTQMIY